MREQQNMVLKYPITQWLHFFMWYFYLIPKVRFRGKMHTVIQGWKIEKKNIYALEVTLWKSLLISSCHGWILVTWERLQQASKFRSKTSWTIYSNHNCCVPPFFFFSIEYTYVHIEIYICSPVDYRLFTHEYDLYIRDMETFWGAWQRDRDKASQLLSFHRVSPQSCIAPQ